MKITTRDKDKMFVSLAAIVARNRLSRGVKLNYPEAIAIITDFVIEGARDGKSVAELMETGAQVIKLSDCMEGIPEMIHEVQVEATFPDGTKLVTVHHPIRQEIKMKPGEIITKDGDIVINQNSKSLSLTVSNKGDRPIQVGSHYHFAEANDYLDFDRKSENGKRLNIA